MEHKEASRQKLTCKEVTECSSTLCHFFWMAPQRCMNKYGQSFGHEELLQQTEIKGHTR